jgi:hypothetical protein
VQALSPYHREQSEQSTRAQRVITANEVSKGGAEVMSEREDLIETVEVQPAAVTTPAAPLATSEQPPADLGKVRELVLNAHPDVVPDLVRGSSVDELIASVEPARSAYQRIAEQVREAGSREGEEIVAAGRSREERDESSTPRLPDSSTQVVVQPPVVPAGGGTNVAEPSDLGPTTKIAQALAARKTRG